MIPKSMKSKFIQFIYRTKYDKLISNLVKKNMYCLDIGFGLGFLKPLVEKYDGNYIGIDPRNDGAFEFAKDTYGNKGYFKGFFPETNPLTKENLKSGAIISLTTLDEVIEKDIFLSAVKNLCSSDTKVYFAVRNLNWTFSSKKNIQSIKGNIYRDYSYEEYCEIFTKNGFDICRIEKRQRPFITSYSLSGIKNFVIILLDKFLTVKKSYMIGFLLIKSN